MTLPKPGYRPRSNNEHGLGFFSSDEEDEINIQASSPKIQESKANKIHPAATQSTAIRHQQQPGIKVGLKLRINKVDLFIQTLGEWYLNLPKIKQENLSKKKFKRKALAEMLKLKLDKRHIPLTYIQLLEFYYAFKLKPEQKKQKNYVDAANTDSDSSTNYSTSSEITPVVTMTRYGRVIKKPQALGYNNCTTAISHRRQRPLANDSISTNNLSHAPRRAKQLVDLTNAVPPKWWVEEYRKGIKLSRELRIYPTQDRVILFYDYGTKDEAIYKQRLLGIKYYH